MSYPGFCAKYGAGKVLSAAYLGPVLVDTFVKAASGASLSALDSTFALNAGTIGFTLAIIAHKLSDIRSSELRLGITKGGERARRAQAIAYAIPVAAALTFNAMVDRKQDGKTADPLATGAAIEEPARMATTREKGFSPDHPLKWS